MQAINPVDVHVQNGWHERSDNKRNVKPSTRGGRQAIRLRTHIVNKPKPKKTKPSSSIPKQVVVPKLVLPVRSRSSSSDRGPWVPPPGRSTKGQKVSWQGPKARLEINPVTEISIDDNESFNQHNTTINSQTNTLSTAEHEKLMRDIQNYEKRIQALIEGIGMLKEQSRKHTNQDQTGQLRMDIDSSLLELEQLQKNHIQRISNETSRLSRSQSLSPIRTHYRSTSADQQKRRRTTTPKVSFQDDPIIGTRRSTTPIKGPIHLNPDRERLLISLTESEADIAQIAKHIISLQDILSKLKFDDQSVSFEMGQLHQHRNELLRLIEQFERSNSKLKEFLRRQYHLEAENGIRYNKSDTLDTRLYELENQNEQIRRLLLDRENDNINLQTELERIKTQANGFDSMKTSLEHNRAHLQRELYAREGEINRLQCALRSLERDLQRGRRPCNNTHRRIERSSVSPMSSRSSPAKTITKTKAITIERLQAELNDRDHQINELKRKLYDNKFDPTDGTNSEIIHLRTKLEQAEHLANEYKAQLYTQTLKTSANNSKNHLSEIELEKIRVRLQKRIEELEPLPKLLQEAEFRNEKLQKYINDLQVHLPEQSTFPTHLPLNDRIQNNHFSSDNDPRILQRKIISLEEQNEKLLKMLNIKEEELRTAQSRLNAKTYEPTSQNQVIDSKKTDFIIREEHIPQKNTYDLEQQISRLRFEYTQLKREKEELERRFQSQMSELRDKLEQSNNTNRAMQNYLNSLRTTYATLFNDTLPTSFTRYTTT